MGQGVPAAGTAGENTLRQGRPSTLETLTEGRAGRGWGAGGVEGAAESVKG